MQTICIQRKKVINSEGSTYFLDGDIEMHLVLLAKLKVVAASYLAT